MKKTIAAWLALILAPLILLTLGLLLFGAPLSGQLPETITIEPAQVTVENFIGLDSIRFIVELPPPDSASIARDEATQRFRDRFIEWMDTCGCLNQGPSGVTQVATAGIVLALGLIWLELRKGNRDGMDGAPGKDGADGVDGQDGRDGVDGQDHTDDDDHDDDSESEHDQ